MKGVIKNQKKMKNTMYIVFGMFALALFVVTMMNPSYANEGLIIDDALDKIVEQTITSNNVSGEDSETSDESLEGDVTEPELTPDKKAVEGDENSLDLENNGDDNNEDEENLDGEEMDSVENEDGDEEGKTEKSDKTSETKEGNNQTEVETPEVLSDEESHGEISDTGLMNEKQNDLEAGFIGLKSIDNEIITMDIVEKKVATLLPGKEFNAKIKNLAINSSSSSYDTVNYNITKIIRSDTLTSAFTTGLISTGENKVIAWFDNGNLYYYSEAKIIYMNEDASYMFSKLNGLERININDFDLTKVKIMKYMFYNSFRGINSLTGINFDFSSAVLLEDINSMFNYAFYNITSISGININFSANNYNNLKRMDYMFNNSFVNVKNIEGVNIDFSGAILSGVDNASYMFQSMFYGYGNMKNVFIDFSNVNLMSLKSTYGMFQSFGYTNSGAAEGVVLDFNNINLDGLENVQRMFDSFFVYSRNSLLSGITINFNKASFNSLTSMKSMFNYAFTDDYNMNNININFSNVKTENLEDMSNMFNNSILPFTTNFNIKNTSVNFDGMKLSNVKNMSNMFRNNEINRVNFNNTNFSSLTNTKGMFQYCRSLTEIDVSNRDTSHVTDMSYMFNGCSSLTEIDVSNWNTSGVSNMEYMFDGCSSLTEIDVSNWNTSNATGMGYIFEGCSSLAEIDVSNRDTSNALKTYGIFKDCDKLVTLDLSSWDTSKVTNMYGMFWGCSNLKTIYVSDKFTTSSVTWPYNTFYSATSIIGGNGTQYSGNHIDAEYARIDTEETPGYFTNILDRPYTITYNTNGGVLSGEKTIYTQRDSFTLPIPIRTGYTFLGWTGSNGLEPEITVNIIEYTVGDLEYTANWGIGKYKIIFDTDGGNEINPIEKDYNSLLIGISLPTPIKECNEFSGWDVELPETMPAHDITLKAIWNYTCSRSSGAGGRKSETTTREIAIDTNIENEHNSANEKENEIKTTLNDETSNQVISVTQEVSEDGKVEAIVETIKIKNTDIVATVRAEVNQTNSSSSSSYTKEQNDAYSFAKSNGITTTESIEDAKMNTELTRIQMAKMLSNFAINVLGQEPDPEKGIVKFDDVTNNMDKQYDNAVTKAYQLGIMGQNVKNNEFRPNDEVTRAEFASALSRLLYQTEEGEYKGTGKYYIPHVAKLYNEGIINKADPKIKEKRGYVMTMLKRTVE